MRKNFKRSYRKNGVLQGLDKKNRRFLVSAASLRQGTKKCFQKQLIDDKSRAKMIVKFSSTRTLFFLPFLLTFQDCNGINCYTCSSINGSNPHCEDPINTHLSVYTEKCMVPKKNHVGLFPANFCIKITGVNTDTSERMIIRACVMKTMDSQCGMFKYQDQAMNGCVLTCDYNGCNKSKKTESSITYLVLITFACIFLSGKLIFIPVN